MQMGWRERVGRWWACGAIVWGGALLGLGIGCAKEDHGIALHPASGQILVAGKPELGVQVRLHPVGKLKDMDAPRPFAATEADGSFSLGTFEAGDGAPVGDYEVTLFWPSEVQGPAAPGDRLSGKFTNITRPPFHVTIQEGANRLEPFLIDPAAGPPNATGRGAKSP